MNDIDRLEDIIYRLEQKLDNLSQRIDIITKHCYVPKEYLVTRGYSDIEVFTDISKAEQRASLKNKALKKNQFPRFEVKEVLVGEIPLSIKRNPE